MQDLVPPLASFECPALIDPKCSPFTHVSGAKVLLIRARLEDVKHMSQQEQEQLPANEQPEPSFADCIRQVVDAVQNIRGDEVTIVGGQALSEIIADGEAPVSVVTADVRRLVGGIRACLRSGLRGRGRGILGPLITVAEPSFWPFAQSLTPQATQDYIHESIAQAGLNADDAEVLELAWLVVMINDGTLADYIRMIVGSPVSARLKWYSKTGGSAILDEAPLKVLEEAALQVCDIYFAIPLADLHRAVHAPAEEEPAIPDEGIKAPPPSPVLAISAAAMEQAPTEVVVEEISRKDTLVGLAEELAPSASEARPEEDEAGKELEEVAADVEMQPTIFNRVHYSISTLLRRHTEPIIDTMSPITEAVLAGNEAKPSTLVEPGNAEAPLHGTEPVEQAKTGLSPQEPKARPSILERMRQSFNALIGEPFMEKTEELLGDTEQQSQHLEQESSDVEPVVEMQERPRVSSRRSSILSELRGSLIDPLRNGSLIERLSRQGSVVSRHSMIQRPSSVTQEAPAETTPANEQGSEQQQ